MPRIDPIDTSKASNSLGEAFAKHCADDNARITNMKATLGHSLTAFQVYMQWYPLYRDVQQVIGERMAYHFAHAISLSADCPLCTMYFRKVIIDAGETPEHLEVNQEEQQLLDFGAAIAANKGIINDDVFTPLSLRYSDREMVILIAFAGQMIATNIFNNVIETRIDDYLQDYLPLPPQKK
jgi:alkylhydroperoxidase family enzyme